MRLRLVAINLDWRWNLLVPWKLPNFFRPTLRSIRKRWLRLVKIYLVCYFRELLGSSATFSVHASPVRRPSLHRFTSDSEDEEVLKDCDR